ncbi:hypothetical protein HAD_04650 [Hyphomonas adhaerens MHS-3]|uniref:Uncharacterized protein n=1 Tax=Hyphomonas adhaerens MHS-3 TaxID=1280949 RepID=A0A069E4F0_9PROT|nr:hypothetical protein [Hyphomonas adhaerens]KCZ84943.1 hypothetical protein HAD_04650 [Hyphomonas adhaerens MHS-3]
MSDTKKKSGGMVLFGVPLVVGLGAVLSFGANLLSFQEMVCSVEFGQPGISDACGAMGFGGKPSRTERLAWQNREAGSCEALRRHIDMFPAGAFRDDAADMLAAMRIEKTDVWEPTQKRLAVFVPGDGSTYADEASARAAVSGRAETKSAQMCKSFAATASYRFTAATAAATDWQCEPSASGYSCDFDGEAICDLSIRHVKEKEVCGST